MNTQDRLAKFTFFRTFRETINDLPQDQQLPFFRAIADFALDGTEPTDLAGVGKACWHTIRAVLESGRNKAVAGAEGGHNGKGVTRNAGNRNAAKTKAEQKQNNSTFPASTRRFTPPAVEEVRAYCVEKGYSIDADRFCDFYTAKGWIVGKVQMKDWRAAVRTWAKNERPAPLGIPAPAPVPAHKALPPED